MFRHFKKKAVAATVAVFLIIAACLVVPPVLLKRELLHEMKSFGLAPISLVVSEVRGGRAIFSDIRLDREGFSTIDNIVVQGGLKGIQSATIDNLILAGDMEGWDFSSISGWQWLRGMPSGSSIETLDLNNGQLDILTPEGAIRLTAKAQMTLQPDGTRKVNAILLGKQNQLILDVRWDIDLHPENASWIAAAEIREARIDFKNLGASRINGWINLDNGKNPLSPPILSGQIAAGQLRFGKNTVLSNVSLTIDTSDGKYHVILQGDITPYKDMRLTADISNMPGSPSIQAAIETKSLPDMIDFISKLQKDLGDTEKDSSFLTSLLITPGNLERVEKEVRRTKYDDLELTVTGTPYDLVGKIIARREKDRAIQRHIISLDPG